MVLIQSVLALFVLFFPVFPADAEPGIRPFECSYELKVWNVHSSSSGQTRKIRHAYSDLAPDEIDAATGCTVCSEDQEPINIPPLAPFSVCSRLAPRVRSALGFLIAEGAEIRSLVGYRVIKSRGPVDEQGNRTQFSNHSFGAALDINPEQNGLYDTCVSFGPACRLLRGGEWRPGSPGTIEKDGAIVRILKREGFRWGGEIEGKQKDFMHFSVTGY